MADTTFRFKVDDSNVEQVMAGIADQIERTDQEYLQLEKDATEALQSIADNTEKTSKKLDEYAGQVEKTAKKTKEAEQETGRFGKGLKALFGSLSIGGISINDLSDSLGTLKGGLKDVASSGRSASDSTANLSKGFGVLRLGLIGIAVLVAGAVVAAFAKFQKNADSLKIGLAQAGAVLKSERLTVITKGDNQDCRDALKLALIAAKRALWNGNFKNQITCK